MWIATVSELVEAIPHVLGDFTNSRATLGAHYLRGKLIPSSEVATLAIYCRTSL